jgi:hypothetical protein
MLAPRLEDFIYGEIIHSSGGRVFSFGLAHDRGYPSSPPLSKVLSPT